MIQGVLVFLAGSAAFVALLHLLAGLRLERPRRQQLMAAFATGIAGYLLLTSALYETRSLETFASLARWQGAVATLVLPLFWWFVAEQTGVRPLPVLAAATALSAAALVANQLSPAGIFYGEILRLGSGVLPWGESVTLPEATGNPAMALFTLGWMGPLPFGAYAVLRQFRSGERRDATILGVGILAVSLPGVYDTFVHGPGPMAFPLNDMALSAFVLLLSLGLTDGVVELARTRRALVASERRARALVDEAPDGIAIVDPQGGRILQLNPAARRLVGLSDDADPGILFSYSPERQPDGRSSAEVARELLEAAVSGQRLATEWTGRRVDASLFPAEVRIGPFPDADGQPLVRLSFLDISERKRAEARQRELTEQLHHAQKIETLGTLAGGISHDFNNLLTPILGHAELALLALEQDSPLREDLELIQASAERARDLVRQILVFSRRSERQMGRCALAEAVRQSLRLVAAGLPASIRLDREIEDVEGRVALDATQVHQLVMNLATNARHAMPDGGLLRVGVRRESAPEEGGAAALLLSVSDTGAGMTSEVAERVFDPFFTTRSPGEGTGLGLSVVHGLVRAAGGTVEVDSRPGEGTCIRLRLPELAEPLAEAEASRSVAPSAPRRILIVDDDPRSVDTIARMASALGHRPEVETDPARALRRLEKSLGELDVVLVDYEMPGMDGAELARRIRALRGGLPVLCVSGAGVPDAARGAFEAVLAKPLPVGELRDALRDVPARDGDPGAAGSALRG